MRRFLQPCRRIFIFVLIFASDGSHHPCQQLARLFDTSIHIVNQLFLFFVGSYFTRSTHIFLRQCLSFNSFLFCPYSLVATLSRLPRNRHKSRTLPQKGSAPSRPERAGSVVLMIRPFWALWQRRRPKRSRRDRLHRCETNETAVFSHVISALLFFDLRLERVFRFFSLAIVFRSTCQRLHTVTHSVLYHPPSTRLCSPPPRPPKLYPPMAAAPLRAHTCSLAIL